MDTTFYIVDTKSPAILGLPSSKAMKLVILNCSVQQKEQLPLRDKRDLQQRFPDCFTGIGRFPGEFHITLMEDAHPVVHASRKLPIHLQKELKEELDRMQELGVITRVTEPTDWVSSLAVSRKSNGKLRVCLDPKDLNRACRRTHHKTPTLEEITHKLSGARVFSKMDARHGYWSIVLDRESSLLTTFNSP
ncbi:uncharacterized protein K02A2.6-like [Lytechinus variegatus]|uniref:uncharacterized protein K02A2.6-like n=1 Tax=Lytechinus variegatus TaxID=7654 RepID=UPI001BB2B932|nr:uncharacterized protein K02A2.6-like [Lytechinus variegatus]